MTNVDVHVAEGMPHQTFVVICRPHEFSTIVFKQISSERALAGFEATVQRKKHSVVR